jgi:hypothetical protein
MPMHLANDLGELPNRARLRPNELSAPEMLPRGPHGSGPGDIRSSRRFSAVNP